MFELAQDALFAPLSPLEDQLRKEGGVKCSPMELYTSVFRLGQGMIQTSTEAPGKYKTNPIIIGMNKGRMHRKILFEDTFAQTLDEFSEFEWAFVSGCTYWGRTNSAERQGKLYALIFDIDYVSAQNVRNFFHGARGTLYPYPNFVVESGHGVHLYYVLDEPIDLFPEVKTQLKKFKYGLTRFLWNRNTSAIKNPQYQGINQAFRIPGGRTKIEGVRAQAWLFEEKPITLAELNEYARIMDPVDLEKRFRKSSMSLQEARQKYPEWYERVVEQGKKGRWEAHPALYEWWLNKITNQEISYGHRYFAIMALAIYAAKCGIFDRDRVRADAVALINHMNDSKPDEPFTETDIDSALECLDARYVRFPRKDIEHITEITIPPNRRNGRPQDIHLRGARAIQKINDEVNGTDWRYHGGAPTKQHIVCAWRAENPNGAKVLCERETGLSRHTVLKWWDSVLEKPVLETVLDNEVV